MAVCQAPAPTPEVVKRLRLKFYENLRKNPKLLPENSRIVVGVSGGQDSMCLVDLLCAFKDKFNWKIKLWHGNHNWRPESLHEASNLKQYLVERYLEKGISVGYSSCGNVEKTEAAARKWRYLALKERCYTKDTIVCTGHTITDRVETMLFNLARGTNLKGLCSLKESSCIPNGNHKLVRPLLGACFTREDTLAYCEAAGLRITEDPSNKSPEYSRNKIRLQILPILEEIAPGFQHRISSLSEEIEKKVQQEEDIYVEDMKLISVGSAFSRAKLLKLDKDRAVSLLHYIIRTKTGNTLTKSAVREVYKQISAVVTVDKATGECMKRLCTGTSRGFVSISWSPFYFYISPEVESEKKEEKLLSFEGEDASIIRQLKHKGLKEGDTLKSANTNEKVTIKLLSLGTVKDPDIIWALSIEENRIFRVNMKLRKWKKVENKEVPNKYLPALPIGKLTSAQQCKLLGLKVGDKLLRSNKRLRGTTELLFIDHETTLWRYCLEHVEVDLDLSFDTWEVIKES